jgi:large subunit ribosomal protein L10
MKLSIKSEIVNNIVESFSKCESAFILSGSIGASANQGFRKELKSSSGGKLKIFKNTLLRIAAENNETIGECKHLFNKQIMLVFSNNDSFKTISSIKSINKKHPSVEVCGGVYQEKFVSANQFKKIANLSSINELHFKLCSYINSPIVKLISALHQISAKES